MLCVRGFHCHIIKCPYETDKIDIHIYMWIIYLEYTNLDSIINYTDYSHGRRNGKPRMRVRTNVVRYRGIWPRWLCVWTFDVNELFPFRLMVLYDFFLFCFFVFLPFFCLDFAFFTLAGIPVSSSTWVQATISDVHYGDVMVYESEFRKTWSCDANGL